MPRPLWSLHAYYFLQLDEQLDLFGCREGWLHGVERQLALAEPADRTLCGKLLPARPGWGVLDRKKLHEAGFCPLCRAVIEHQKTSRQPGWTGQTIVGL